MRILSTIGKANMNYRIGIVALLHESNTFITQNTTLAHFQQDTLLTGEAIRERFADAPHEVGGFFAGLGAADNVEIVPIFAARAIPYGPIEASTFDQLIETMVQQCEAAGPLDGILAAPHGATVAEGRPDADGYMLSRLRELLGPDRTLIATIDAHANVSPAMADATDALVSYRTNPHLDQRQRGVEAAQLMVKTLTSGRRLHQLAAFPPVAINIQNQNTSAMPLRPRWEAADALRELPEVASLSLVLGFPYSDVAEMGCSAILVSYEDVPAARRQELLDQLTTILTENPDCFEPEFTSPAEAVQQAGQQPGLTCMLDMGDNAGGGSPADSTILAHELHRQKIGPSLAVIFDPEAVAQVTATDFQNGSEVSIGGKTDSLHGEPLQVAVELLSTADGKFRESEARHGGFSEFDQGATAIVRTLDSDLTLMLTSQRVPPFSLSQLTTFGIEPKEYRAIVAKGVIAPMAAYQPVADRFIHVNTQGSTCADMLQMTYHHRRQPMFPFER
ncbi:M81 family metallopeptidase [Rosistilla oblonga]|uniref:M81 family metallopeptidase n=1 Tax=Rosistilla oblonga TaxID=2527990 RepID=UPI003A9696D2